MKQWYIIRSSGNNDNSVILFRRHAGISSLLQCLGRLSQPIAIGMTCYWHDSRPWHCSRADIPAWRPKKSHYCINNSTSIVSYNGLLPGWCKAIMWTNDMIFWTFRNKLQWNFNWNSYIFIQETVFENIVCEMATILSKPQCVKGGMWPLSRVRWPDGWVSG